VARRWTVDDAGITLPGHHDGALDVYFDEHRIWSFSTQGEGKRAPTGIRVPWPARLKPLLRGTTRVRVLQHLDGSSHVDQSVAFAGIADPLVLEDDQGNPISVDKNGRLQRSFSQMQGDSRGELVAVARKLSDALTDLGVDVYLAYGCLLGAVRTGHLIGHDSDVDLAFLSKYEHPFDIIREARWIEEKVREMGFEVIRLSAVNFKVWAPLPNGKRAGIDVFGSFYVGDTFHITGNLRGDLPRAALKPFGEATLEGITFPAPAELDTFLSFTYGPGWRVPDPAFHFSPTDETKAKMNAWLRTTRNGLRHWDDVYRAGGGDRDPREHSSFAAWVNDRLAPGSFVFEVGAGTALDALWLREQGHSVTATDFSAVGRRTAVARAGAENRPIKVTAFNVNSPRMVLLRGAKLARREGLTNVYARNLLDVLRPSIRPYFWRFCSMACRSGGKTYVEFRPRLDADAVRAEIAAAGGHITADETVGTPADRGSHRMEVSWKR